MEAQRYPEDFNGIYAGAPAINWSLQMVSHVYVGLATTKDEGSYVPAAKLQAMGYEAYFYEPAAGGHGYGKDNAERASFTALGYNFLRRAIGWDA